MPKTVTRKSLCYRVEAEDGNVVGRFTTDGKLHIVWHYLYMSAGRDATLDTLLAGIADGRYHVVEIVRTANDRE
jgi:hypothetical protein